MKEHLQAPSSMPGPSCLPPLRGSCGGGQGGGHHGDTAPKAQCDPDARTGRIDNLGPGRSTHCSPIPPTSPPLWPQRVARHGGPSYGRAHTNTSPLRPPSKPLLLGCLHGLTHARRMMTREGTTMVDDRSTLGRKVTQHIHRPSIRRRSPHHYFRLMAHSYSDGSFPLREMQGDAPHICGLQDFRPG